MSSKERAAHEIELGRLLARCGAESLWGWDTPAGRLRAKRRAQLIVERARITSGARVLEIGCGVGMFTEMFAETGAQIVAVDISPDLLAIARMRGLPKVRVEFLEARFEECEGSGPFDAIIGSSVLHHLEIDIALQRIYELLKPGGRLSFAEPNMLNPQIFLERWFRSFFPYVSPDETAFMVRSLYDRLKQAGFSAVRIVPFDWLHPSTPPRLIGGVSRLGSILEQVPLIRHFAGSLIISAAR